MILGVSHSQCTAVTNDCETHAGRFDSSYRQKVIREDALLRGARFFIRCDSKDTLSVSWDDLPRHAQQIAIDAGEDDSIIVGKILERDTCEGVELLIVDNLSSLTAGLLPSRHTAKAPIRSRVAYQLTRTVPVPA
jgi:hypothetical protein